MPLRRIAAALLLSAGVAASGSVRPETLCDPPDFTLGKGECRSVALDPDAGEVRVSLAVDFPKNALRGRGTAVCLTFAGVGGEPVYRASLSVAEDPASAGFDELALRLHVDSVAPGGAAVALLDRYVSADANVSGGINCLVADKTRVMTRFYIGGNKMSAAGEVATGAPVHSVGLTVTSRMDVRRFEVRQSGDPAVTLMTPWTAETLAARFAASSDPVEGFWSFLDRDNEPEWAIPGGFYELAVVKSETVPGGYDIIYLGGASVEGSSWHPGMRKGSLTPTIFADHYRLGWVDARFQTDYPECTADLSASNTILTLSFPLHHSTIRFSRRPLRQPQSSANP